MVHQLLASRRWAVFTAVFVFSALALAGAQALTQGVATGSSDPTASLSTSRTTVKEPIYGPLRKSGRQPISA